jgi:hypothetical protein
MKERLKLAIGLFSGFAFAAALLLLLIFFWGRFYSPPYISTQPKPPPAAPTTSTPDDLGKITARVEALETDNAYNLKVFEWKLDQKLLILGWVALAISLAGGALGIKTFNDLEKVINEEVRRALDKALYRLDPTNLSIWIVSYEQKIDFRGDAILDEEGRTRIGDNRQPMFETIHSDVSDEMKKAQERIQLTGLLNTKFLRQPDQNCYDGVTVLPIFDREMEEEFRNFLERNQANLDPERAAFVLYTKDHHVSQTLTLAKYVNLATANMLPTITSMILTVGRGLSKARLADPEEKKK